MAELEAQENGGDACNNDAAMGNQSVARVTNRVLHANVLQVQSHSVSTLWFKYGAFSHRPDNY